jgi:hypothetical protein
LRLTFREAVAAAVGAVALAGLLIAADRLGLWGYGRVPYSNHDGCDPWYYFSLIMSPQSGAVLAEGTRFISRPLYFAPPHLLRVLFPGLDPNLASFLFFLPLSTAALYLGLRAMFGRATSVTGALLIGTAPLLVNMASGTYVPVGSAAYEICMLACLLWAGRSAGEQPFTHALTSFLAGVFFVFAANANMMAIKFDILYVLLAIPVQFVVGSTRSPAKLKAWLARAGAAFALGVALGILFILVLSHALGLGFTTPLEQVVAAVQGIDQRRYPNWAIDTVAFALLALISVLAAFAAYRRRGPDEVAVGRIRLVVGISVGTCLFHLFALVALNDMSLVYDWWYFLLLPCVALTFCAAFGDRIEAEPRLALSALVGTVIVANFLLSQIHLLKLFLFQNTQYVSYAVVGLLALVLVLRSRAPAVLAGIALATLSLQAANSSLMRYHYFGSLEDERSLARVTEKALGFILPRLAEKPVVWIATADNHGLDLPIYRSLVRCSYKASFPDRLPDPQTHWQPQLEAGRTLVLIDGKASSMADIEAALARHGLTLHDAASRYFSRVNGTAQGVQVTVGQLR